MLALKVVEGMTAWSVDVLMEFEPHFMDCSRDIQEGARVERSTGVGYAG